MTTYFAAIGNYDNKLEQQEWSLYCDSFEELICAFSENIYSVAYSLPNSSYQNMCIGFEISSQFHIDELKKSLAVQAKAFRQDSIALSEVKQTEWIGEHKNTGFERIEE